MDGGEHLPHAEFRGSSPDMRRPSQAHALAEEAGPPFRKLRVVHVPGREDVHEQRFTPVVARLGLEGRPLVAGRAPWVVVGADRRAYVLISTRRSVRSGAWQRIVQRWGHRPTRPRGRRGPTRRHRGRRGRRSRAAPFRAVGRVVRGRGTALVVLADEAVARGEADLVVEIATVPFEAANTGEATPPTGVCDVTWRNSSRSGRRQSSVKPVSSRSLCGIR